MSNLSTVLNTNTKIQKLAELKMVSHEEIKNISDGLLYLGLEQLMRILTESPNDLDTKERLMLENLKIKAVSAITKIQQFLLEKDTVLKKDEREAPAIPVEYRVGDA